MSNETRAHEEDAAWKSKVRSLDDTLKSLRSGGGAKPKSKSKEKPKKPVREPGRGFFSFPHAPVP